MDTLTLACICSHVNSSIRKGCGNETAQKQTNDQFSSLSKSSATSRPVNLFIYFFPLLPTHPCGKSLVL
jgi:hypothetical protein